MLVLTTFSYDEHAHFEKYTLTMPVGRGTLVKKKYMLLLLLVAGGTILGMILGGVMTAVFKGDYGRDAHYQPCDRMCVYECVQHCCPRDLQNGGGKRGWL